MPIYVYKNQETGETFEVQQSIKEDALKEDPKTGAPVHRVIQPVGISFKGSGFYINDSKNTKSTSTPPAASTDSSSDTKADTKSDASSDKSSSTKSDTSKSDTSKSDTKAASSSGAKSEAKSSSSPAPAKSSTKKS